MQNIRKYVYLAFIIFGALVSFGCRVNVNEETKEEKEQKEERKKKMLEDYGGERKDFKPVRPEMP